LTPKQASSFLVSQIRYNLSDMAEQNDDMAKMAIKDLEPALEPTENEHGEESWDYGHMLPEAWQGKLNMHVTPDAMGGQVHVHLTDADDPTNVIGTIKAYTGRGEGWIEPHSDIFDSQYQGHGLGKAMYEALYAHAFHHMGKTVVEGGPHTHESGHVHEALARKHGLQYRPTEKGGIRKYPRGPYKYTLKMEKGEIKQPITVTSEEEYNQQLRDREQAIHAELLNVLEADPNKTIGGHGFNGVRVRPGLHGHSGRNLMELLPNHKAEIAAVKGSEDADAFLTWAPHMNHEDRRLFWRWSQDAASAISNRHFPIEHLAEAAQLAAQGTAERRLAHVGEQYRSGATHLNPEVFEHDYIFDRMQEDDAKLPDDVRQRLLGMDWSRLTGGGLESSLLDGILKHPKTTPEEAQKLWANNTHRNGMVHSPLLPADQTFEWAMHPNNLHNTNYGLHPNWSGNQLREWYQAQVNGRQRVAGPDVHPERIVRALMYNMPQRRALGLAIHSNTPPEVLRDVARLGQNVRFRMLAAGHPNLDAQEALAILRNTDEDSEARAGAMYHPGVSAHDVQQVLPNLSGVTGMDWADANNPLMASMLKHGVQALAMKDPDTYSQLPVRHTRMFNVGGMPDSRPPPGFFDQPTVQHRSLELPDVSTERIRQLRDKVVAGGGTVHHKTLGNLPPSLKPLLDHKGQLSSDKLQEAIDSVPTTKYWVTPWGASWAGAQRHSHEQSKVFHVNYTNAHVQKMKEAGVWPTFARMQTLLVNGQHPLPGHGIGWVRYTQGQNDGHYHIDEVQSDLGQARLTDEFLHYGMTIDPKHLETVHNILWGKRKTANDMLGEAFLHHLRQDPENHDKTIHWPSHELKLAQNATPPKDAYKRLPKDLGFEENAGTYGDLETQTGLGSKAGAPTHVGKVRKAEDDLDYFGDKGHRDRLVNHVQQSLSDELRGSKYRANPNTLAGHCYVASESLYHLLGGYESGWVPQNIRHENDSHWYLKHKDTDEILDPTADQFETPVPYENGRGKGFLTKNPSKRAAQVIERVNARLAAERDPSVEKSDLDLSKNALLGPVLALGMTFGGALPGRTATAPDAQAQATKPSPAKWTPEGLHPDLIPIAHLESSFGLNVQHAPNSKGDFHTAYGALGFKPVTAHEEYLKSKPLQETFPNLKDPAEFLKQFKSNPQFYNTVASAHFLRLKARHGSPEKAAYAWRWGTGAAGAAGDDKVEKDSYVMRYRHLATQTGLQKAQPKKLPAYRHRTTGSVVETGFFHDVSELPGQSDKGWEAGYTVDGAFLPYDQVIPLDRLQEMAHAEDELRDPDDVSAVSFGPSTGSLRKMAIKDIKPGEKVGERQPNPAETLEIHDYTHLLPKEIRNLGHKLHVRSSSSGITIAEVPTLSVVDGSRSGKAFDVGVAWVAKPWRGKGIGKATYEALYAHLYHHHGVRTIMGDVHSTNSHRVHQSLAQKHGLKYEAKRINRSSETGASDDAFGSYEYALKSEG
jgi:GNAT superfamily N-acetyltransferase